jgi:hypothetical protein
MLLFLEIMAVLFMISLMFVAIWGFISLNQMLGQMKYKNYLLEKLTQNIYMLATKDSPESYINKTPQNDEKNTEISDI